MKTLIVYFSAEGTTARLAKQLSEALEADLYEIKPLHPYTQTDIRYTNPLARCNREMIGKKDVPVVGRIAEFGTYDTVFIGFPIWYGGAPNVVSTFCKEYDWSGKKAFIFATSGGSGIGKTAERLQPYLKGGEIIGAKVFKDIGALKDWAETLL